MRNLIFFLAFVMVCTGLYAYFYVEPTNHDTGTAMPEQALPPLTPPPPPTPAPLDRIRAENPHLTQQQAEAYENERIAINVKLQEKRVVMLKQLKDQTPEGMMKVEIGIADEMTRLFSDLDKRYGIKRQSAPPIDPTTVPGLKNPTEMMGAVGR
jgi:hypothetical protein